MMIMIMIGCMYECDDRFRKGVIFFLFFVWFV